MYWYTMFPLTAFFVNMLLAFYIFHLESKKEENYFYFFAAISTALWSFGNFQVFTASTIQNAIFWSKFTSIAALLSIYLYSLFLLVFSKNKLVKGKRAKILMGIPAFVLIFVNYWTDWITTYAREVYWGYDPIRGSLYSVHSLTLTAYIITGLISCLVYYNELDSIVERVKVEFVSIAVSIPVIVGMTTEIINEILGFSTIPPMTSTSSIILSSVIAYTIFKYGLMRVTPAMAASNILDTMNDFLILTNKENKIIKVNKATIRALGYSQKELKGKYFNFLLDSSNGTEKANILTALEQGKTVKNVDKKVIQKRGEILFCSINAAPIRDANEEIRGYVYTIRDLSEQKEMEEALKEREAKLRNLYKVKPLIEDVDSVEELYDVTIDIAKKVLDFDVCTVEIEENGRLYVRASTEKELFKNNFSFADDEGIAGKTYQTKKSFLIQDIAQYSEAKPTSPKFRSAISIPFGDMGVFQALSYEKGDFTEQDIELVELFLSYVTKAIEHIREKEKRVSLQRLDKLRNQFLSMAAHEINTPLTPIQLRLEMLQTGARGDLTEEQEEEIAQTLVSVQRLQRLVDNFQRITKLRTGGIQLLPEKIRLADLIESALAGYQEILTENHIKVIKNIEEPYELVCDPGRVTQVLQNLLENAIDYTDDTIWITVGKNQEHVWFSVRDNGPGIPEEEQDKIFKAFYRVEKDRRREDRDFGGSGLGLHICKLIVDAHQGKIKVDSALGEGSTFTVFLPKKNHVPENKYNQM